MIKRGFYLILALICICGCVPSCSGGDKDADVCEVLLKLCEVGGNDGKSKAIFYSDATRKCENVDFGVLSGEDFGYLYDGKFEKPVCFDRIDGYALRMPLDTGGYEIHAIRCVNISDCEEIEKMLLSRVEKMQNSEILEYAPESYEICFRGAIVYTYGHYVFLLATPDNEAVIKKIKRIL
jgi:hypothetical protein